VTGIKKDAKGNKYVEFEFNVSGQLYKGSSRVKYDIIPEVGGHHKVIYSYKDGDVNKMTVD
jgi:hypothetical protein